MLRSLAQAAVVAGSYPGRSRPREAAEPKPGRRPEPAWDGWGGALANLEMERIEEMVRRYHKRPARIESPFAAFPTRSYWLSKLMNDPG